MIKRVSVADAPADRSGWQVELGAWPALPFGDHDCDGDATNAHQAAESSVVVVLEAIVKAVEPALECFGLWPHHRNDEPRFGDRPTDLDAWRLIESLLDVDR